MNIDFSLITLISLTIVLLVQPLRSYADRKAYQAFKERVGEDYAGSATPEHAWLEDRHLIGRWGRLYIALQVIQGVAIITTIGGVVYWWLL